MAGIVHEVENRALLNEVRQQAADAAKELAEAARLRKGQIVVVGCSTSEGVGRKVGSWSTPEVARAMRGIFVSPTLRKMAAWKLYSRITGIPAR